jgi:hypothetical protein
VQVLIKIFKKGFLDPQSAIDESIELGESVTKRILKPTNKLNQSFKNIVFNKMEIMPLAESNDNSMIIDLEYTVRAILNVT